MNIHPPVAPPLAATSLLHGAPAGSQGFPRKEITEGSGAKAEGFLCKSTLKLINTWEDK